VALEALAFSAGVGDRGKELRRASCSSSVLGEIFRAPPRHVGERQDSLQQLGSALDNQRGLGRCAVVAFVDARRNRCQAV